MKSKFIYRSNESPDQPAVVERREPGLERRQYLRVQLHTRAYYRSLHQDSWIESVIVDVSQGGAQVTIPARSAPDSVGDVITLKFRIGAEYQIDAKVVWVDAAPRQRRIGLEWISLADQKRQHLAWEIMRLAVHRRRAHRPLI